MVKIILAFIATFAIVLCIYNIVESFKYIELFSAMVVTAVCGVIALMLLTLTVLLF